METQTLTINKKWTISRRLALESTIISDMVSDCNEFPSNIEVENLVQDIKMICLHELEEYFINFKDQWIIPHPKCPNILCPKELMKLAIRFDMRRIMSIIAYWNSDHLDAFLVDQNILKACLENCNGYAYHILEQLKDCCPNSYGTIMYHLKEFPKYDKLSNKTLIHVQKGFKSELILQPNGYMVRHIYLKNFESCNILIDDAEIKKYISHDLIDHSIDEDYVNSLSKIWNYDAKDLYIFLMNIAHKLFIANLEKIWIMLNYKIFRIDKYGPRYLPNYKEHVGYSKNGPPASIYVVVPSTQNAYFLDAYFIRK